MKFNHALILILLVGLVISYLLGYTPLLLATLYLFFSLVCFWCYARDKKAAVNGDWRTPEDTLHLLSLCGGWPGAMLAQDKYRHKTTKRSFRFFFWLTVLLNIAAAGWLHTPSGNALLHTVMAAVSDATDAYLPHKPTVLVIQTLVSF